MATGPGSSNASAEQGPEPSQKRKKVKLFHGLFKPKDRVHLKGTNIGKWVECTKHTDASLGPNMAMDANLVESALTTVENGTPLSKVKSLSRLYQRNFKVDMDDRVMTSNGGNNWGTCIGVPGNDVIAITDIHDVRKGWQTDTFNRVARQVAKLQKKQSKRAGGPQAHVDEKNCFSIVYGKGHNTLDLVCADENLCNAWVRALTHLIAVQKSVERDQNYRAWLRDQFNDADLDHSGALNFEECCTLLRQLNIEMDKLNARKLFDLANKNKTKKNGEDVLDGEEFFIFYKALKKRPEIEELFSRYTAGSNMMNPNQLKAFLESAQKTGNITLEDTYDIMEIYEPKKSKVEGFLGLDGFRLMLFSEPMDIYNYAHRKVWQDMTQPLNSYFIASSHNTYLIADQLAGESSVEGYIMAFKMGCRCVELDLWDGPDGEPIVYHGYTLTTKILLKDIIMDAIKPYAFATSEFPVILSLENHLGLEQQKVAARYLKTILGDMLYVEKVPPDMKLLPSPADLKRKIIIKNKKLPPELEFKGGDVDVSDSDDENTRLPPDGTPKKKKANLARELSQLVNLCEAVHFHSFQYSKEKDKCSQMSSLSENKAASLASTSGREYVQYTQRQLNRIYPGAKRQDSSNYNPIQYWMVGSQIIALNYQTPGKYMTYNRAMFLQNGGCGYVLKPKILREEGSSFDPYKTLDNRFLKTLTIKVISGQHIPRPGMSNRGDIIDPYVVIRVKGHLDDSQTVRTKHVNNNGFNPMWSETFTLPIKLPEMALIHFLVYDHQAVGKDELLGEHCLPFISIQQGYRHIQLVDVHNKPLAPGSIFVHVTTE